MPATRTIGWRGLDVSGHVFPAFRRTQQPVLLDLAGDGGSPHLLLFRDERSMRDFVDNHTPVEGPFVTNNVSDSATFLDSVLGQVRLALYPAAHPIPGGEEVRWTEVTAEGDPVPSVATPNDDAVAVIREMKAAALAAPLREPKEPEHIERFSRRVRFTGREYDLVLTYMDPLTAPNACWHLTISRDVPLETAECVQMATAFLGDGWQSFDVAAAGVVLPGLVAVVVPLPAPENRRQFVKLVPRDMHKKE